MRENDDDMKLLVAHVDPDLFDGPGDQANLLALERRCQWRSLRCQVQPVYLEQGQDLAGFDLVYLGSGKGLWPRHADWVRINRSKLADAVAAGSVFLCLGVGFWLMGQTIQAGPGQTFAGAGLLDCQAYAGGKRLVGDLVAQSAHLAKAGLDPWLLGFENHAIRVDLGPATQPLARVVRGSGNNGQDQTEGAVSGKVFASHGQGGLLPLNPALADHLIALALASGGAGDQQLDSLDNTWEDQARSRLLAGLRQTLP